MKFNIFNRQSKDNQSKVTAIADTTDYSKNDKDYSFIFNDTSGADINCPVVTFGNLTESGSSETLTIYKKGTPITKLILHCYYYSSDKTEAIKFHKFVAIGLSGFFFLYDLSSEKIVFFIDVHGYFEEFKIYEDILLVAYNSGIYCLTKYGQINWHNSNLGIDGIIVDQIQEGKIIGSAQIDPPDGWTKFTLDLNTGKVI